MDFELLFRPVEQLDDSLTRLFEGAPLLLALGIAFVLGLRHASDPDHLIAVTSLVAADDADHRDAARLGAWWGLGHATMLLAIGLPLILLKSELPAWLESGAEKAVGVVIVVLAARVMWKWARGDYRAGKHRHDGHGHRHLHHGDGHHDHVAVRTPTQAFGIGVLHGLAGTGAVVLLLIAALPTQLGGGRRTRRVRADVGHLDGGLHHGLRLGAHTPGDRAGLPSRSDSGARPVRAHVRPLVRGPDLGSCSSGCIPAEAGHTEWRASQEDGMPSKAHEHDRAHSHEHEHDGERHSHPHTDHTHQHTEHEHEHSHGDVTHSHPHVHQKGLEGPEHHDHDHDEGEGD